MNFYSDYSETAYHSDLAKLDIYKVLVSKEMSLRCCLPYYGFGTQFCAECKQTNNHKHKQTYGILLIKAWT